MKHQLEASKLEAFMHIALSVQARQVELHERLCSMSKDQFDLSSGVILDRYVFQMMDHQDHVIFGGLLREQNSYVLQIVQFHSSLMSCLFLTGWLWQSCKMSMVLFASVVRVEDGLPLSASTDYEQDKDLQETKRHLKGLSKKLSQFPDRCTLKSGAFNVK